MTFRRRGRVGPHQLCTEALSRWGLRHGSHEWGARGPRTGAKPRRGWQRKTHPTRRGAGRARPGPRQRCQGTPTCQMLIQKTEPGCCHLHGGLTAACMGRGGSLPRAQGAAAECTGGLTATCTGGLTAACTEAHCRVHRGLTAACTGGCCRVHGGGLLPRAQGGSLPRARGLTAACTGWLTAVCTGGLTAACTGCVVVSGHRTVIVFRVSC